MTRRPSTARSPARRTWSVVLVLVAAATPASAAVTWEDATSSAGLDFRLAGEIHFPLGQNPENWPAFPEILGGGACFADLDGDGLDDLYLVNQQYNPENDAGFGWADDVDPTSRYYTNNGDGTFTDRSVEAGVDARRFGYGCSAADYDGDADMDLFLSTYTDPQWGGNVLYRNNGDGTFTDVAEAAGVAMVNECGDFACTPTSSSWGDYDLDGDLDLYVGTYVDTTLTDVVRGPGAHRAQLNRLFRNNADGTFAEVAQQAGVAGLAADENGAKTFGVAWFDYDLDGDLDLFAANDETPDDFYENLGDGTFVERSDEAGVADRRAGMGLTVGDYDGDGFPDLFFTHYQAEDNGFYRNKGDKTFEDRSGEEGLHAALDLVGWGTSFVDYDRDMDLDILACYGHTEPILPTYDAECQVYRNDPEAAPAGPGDREWVHASADHGPGLSLKKVTRGVAFADYDLDGDTDFVRVNNGNESANFIQASGQTNHWLYVELDQPGLNRHGVGARVLLEAGGVTQYREVQAGSSFNSQNTLHLEYGLGTLTQADKLTVEWRGGGTTVLTDLPADRVVRVRRATGDFLLDTISPLTTSTLTGTAGSDGWFRSSVTATLAATDRAIGPASGVVGTQYNLEGAGWLPYTGQTFTFTAEGVHPLWARSTDGVGNVEPIRRTPVKIDLTPPTLAFELAGTAGDNGWWVSPDVTVDPTATDPLSGVAGFRFRVDGGAWASVAGPFAIAGEGIHAVEFTATDRAGNAAPIETVEIKIDSLAPDVGLEKPLEGRVYVGDAEAAAPGAGPAVIVTGPAVAGTGGVTFTVDAASADATSGVSRVVFLLDGTVVAVDRAAPFAWSWDTHAYLPGEYHLDVVAIDRAGNLDAETVHVALASGCSVPTPLPTQPPYPPLPPPLPPENPFPTVPPPLPPEVPHC